MDRPEKHNDNIMMQRLRCPDCHRVKIRSLSPDVLECAACGAAYPVIGCIPRLLVSSMLPQWVSDYATILEKMPPHLLDRLPKPLTERESQKVLFKGVGEQDYTKTRHHVSTVKYSLKRRMQTVGDVLAGKSIGPDARLLELGCADGRIGAYLGSRFGINDIVGVDLQDLDMQYNPHPCIQGDCQNLPFADGSFDVLVGAALIEHLPEPITFLAEVHRVLSPDGIVVLTCPDQRWDWICTKTGYFKYANHLNRFSLLRLKEMLLNNNFMNVGGYKFMLLPFNLPILRYIEKGWMGKLLAAIMMNQVVWGHK
jgi:ubiquinone/menaquinone biosynthesis C-methylase UbiE/uncharacterized protein YbaR (Trm112 family)